MHFKKKERKSDNDNVSIGRIPNCPKPHIQDEDVDVAEERQRIYRSGKSSDILRVRDLSKVRGFLYYAAQKNKTKKKLN